MKKNTIKFWFKNRLVAIFALWLLFAFCVTNNPHFNAFIFFILSFGSIFYMTYLFEEGKANASEKLMWQKIDGIIK